MRVEITFTSGTEYVFWAEENEALDLIDLVDENGFAALAHIHNREGIDLVFVNPANVAAVRFVGAVEALDDDD